MAGKVKTGRFYAIPGHTLNTDHIRLLLRLSIYTQFHYFWNRFQS